MKMKADFLSSIISVLLILLIVPGIIPGIASALDGQLGDDINPTNDTPTSNLVLEKLSANPRNPEPDGDVTISALVKNVGDAASDPTSILYTIGEANEREDVQSIEPGVEETISYTWTAPEKEGTVTIKASIEGVDSQKETSVTVRASRPDLIIQNIVTDPAHPQEGQPLNFTVKVKNRGSAPSGDALATYNINEAPGQSINIPPLSEGESTNIAFSLTPDQVKAGEMEVKVVADSGNTVPESNEDNNVFSIKVNVNGSPPDLTVESISLNPETPKVGDNITFTAAIRNIGAGASPDSKLKYYINGTNEAYSGELSVPALAAGEATQGIFSWTPKNEGSIQVTALVDPDAVIPESNEMNNQLSVTATVTREITSTGSGGGGGSSSSSSSGSGMGSSFTKEPAKNVASKELATRNVMSGKHIRYDFLQNGTCVRYIEYDAVRTFLKTTTTVEELKGKSTFVPELPFGKTYKFINIWVGGKAEGLPASLKNGSIGFKVEKSWINNNNVNESLVTLQRYDKSWEPLPTEKVGEDNTYSYFTSKTPGFFFFAITYTGEVGENGTHIGANLQNTSGSLGNASNKSGNTSKLQDEARGAAKILMAIFLPLFLIFVGYLVVKKKI